MSLVSGKSSMERGGSVRIQHVSRRMPFASVASDNGESQLLLIMVRYLVGDTNIFCSSIGGG